MTAPRGLALVASLALVLLPAVLVPIQAMSFYAANRASGRLVSSGETREYSLHVPSTYDRGTPTPLVISLHGAALWGAAQERISGWDDLADRERFIVVYPTGARGDGPRVWHADERSRQSKDVRFISDLIDTLRRDYNIDPARIYADGLSNGGDMSFMLSCAMPDTIAAVGLVSAAHLLPWSWCGDSRPVPMIEFHGTADPVVPYAGGRSWVAPRPFPNIPAWTANWARRNRCVGEPVDAAVAPTVTRRSYQGCADGADVELYTIRGGAHDWPGGAAVIPEWLCGPPSRGVDATAKMWAFFRDHPRHATRESMPPPRRPGT